MFGMASFSAWVCKDVLKVFNCYGELLERSSDYKECLEEAEMGKLAIQYAGGHEKGRAEWR